MDGEHFGLRPAAPSPEVPHAPARRRLAERLPIARVLTGRAGSAPEAWTRAWLSRQVRRVWRPASAVAGVLSILIAGVGGVGSPAQADSCSPNPIVCENAKDGTPESVWDIHGSGDDTIQGFATDISVNIGQTINFKIKTDAPQYTIDIYRLGYYKGDGARYIDSVTPIANVAEHQPDNCLFDPDTEIYDCGSWAVTASWPVPVTAVSGVYVATLKRTDNQGKSQITFIVRNDASHSQMLFKTSDATWQAYNMYGGADFYHGFDNGRAYKLSYNRPFATRGDNSGRDFLFSNEYPMIRFLERNGYDVSYTTDVDADRYGSLIRNHNIFLSVGHDEYWSENERDNVEAARDAGVNLAFFSGNEVYWKTRWEPSEDGSSTDYRTLVTYKETWDPGHKLDPTDDWTGTWRDPTMSPPYDGGQPENALTGTAYMANSDDLALQVPPDEGLFRLWRYSGVARQAALGQTSTLTPHTVGYESDEDLDNGFRPAGLIDLSTTVGDTPQYLQDFGLRVAPGTTTHHMTLYRAPSGALVFGAGTIQWAWGLDDDHDGTEPPADPSMQQATVNLFADMGVQPATLMAGLTPATASADTQAPTVTITAPAADSTVANGAQVTLMGSASDVGGHVAAVEVSTDGGTTWHRANGTGPWSYTFIAAGVTDETVFVRGVDDSVNIGSTPASLHLKLTGLASLFGNVTPAVPAANDSSSVEVGVKVVPHDDGFITGVRFYKGSGNTGTHTGTLWSSTGTKLATGTFVNETANGWQTLTFSTPVAVTANTTYVASYYAPSGHYSADNWSFIYAGSSAGPLSTPRSGDVGGNGLYRAGTGFPTNTFQAANYYVDVLFQDESTVVPTVMSNTPSANALYVPTSTSVVAAFSKALDPTSVRFTLTGPGGAVAGTTTYDAGSKSATFTPSAPLAAGMGYTASVQGHDLTGKAVTGTTTWSFTTESYTGLNTLFATGAVPVVPATADTNATEVGVKFTPSVNGSVVGVRFYKGDGNTGPHTGSLWTGTGVLLARVTFGSETGTGWQTAHFDTPVSVSAGSTYVVSYYAPFGHYAADANAFGSPLVSGALTAPSGGNGVYRYGSDAFPSSSYQSSNYWVDPLFLPGAGPTGSPTPSVPPPPTTSSSTTAPASPTPTISDGPPVSPSPLPSGVVGMFTNDDSPATSNWNDPKAIEVGLKFFADAPGVVTGVRFYKGSMNTGVHQGSLWTSTGVLLATATFSNETSSGWQMVTFSTPVRITPNTTYVVSYSTTVGYYSATLNVFTSQVNKPPLHVATNGGAYRYGSGFPGTASKNNYWDDAMFLPDSTG
ncbi:DUF4082 domain-containing protein [Rugosimonospora africana]|uniref:Ig-like domain-containing protein n=1 Tax=Rugosimonospora africana TaxID=556532 RepID=A0A8J3QMZ2_9ACTN|nr:DUF4082 domain-containing protein [Rugosimonospora africana]GIH12932.1 hypothetical protein Raf01_11040 [Rugosimonospora africana]